MPRTGPPYPFEDFLRDSNHFHDLEELRDPDGTVPFEAMVIHVNRSMKTVYTDWQECFYKTSRLIMIMQYIAEHIRQFDREDFAVNGSPKVGALVGHHLIKAVHHFYTTNPLPSEEPSVDEVMKLAATYRTAREPANPA